MAQGGRGYLALPAAPHYIIISRPGPAYHLGLNPAVRICNHCITLPDLCPSPPLPAPAADCLQIPTKNGRQSSLHPSYQIHRLTYASTRLRIGTPYLFLLATRFPVADSWSRKAGY